MSGFRFPFNWGSVADAVSSTTTAARWTSLSAPAKNWIEGVSTPHRFERIYAQPRSTFGQSINFAYEIRSEFPFIISSNAQVVITSTITNP